MGRLRKDRPASPKIAILDFGSQYTQVIARRVRECRVYSEIFPHTVTADELRRSGAVGVVLSGGPASVYGKKAPRVDQGIYRLGVPVLGICYGMQLISRDLGGEVEPSDRREYGSGRLKVARRNRLFAGLPRHLEVWNSHGDKVTRLPRGFAVVGTTENSKAAAIADAKRNFYGLQFHPEVSHTPRGSEIIENFVLGICGCRPEWTPGSFIERACREIRAQVGDDRVVLGLSGGVDSSVAAALLHKAIGDQLTCIFVDNGVLRAGEREWVREIFGKHFSIDLRIVDASARFFRLLKGVTDPERKRKIIGNEFVRVFEQTAKSLARRGQGRPYRFLAQGTLYPDVIESVSFSGGPSVTIKSHHNVGGLPEKMGMKLVEPLRELFKDEVRALGRELGLPDAFIGRHPFPGPGLAIRCPGEITREKLDILRRADAVYIDQIRKHGLYDEIWQAFAAILPMRTVGVMGDGRTYDYALALRAVTSVDGMTADYYPFTHEFLGETATRIINEVQGVNRVFYDCTSKPPGTIELE